MNRRTRILAFLLALLGPAAARAQPQITLAPAKLGKLANLAAVPAPDARWVALSEPLRLLAFCHEREHKDAQVSLVRLDDKGNPAPYALSWKLPRPDALAKWPNYALAAAFHPKLPLLYVWQDIALHYTNPLPKLPPELKTFDHLLIYDISKEPPELLVALCRGDEVVHGSHGGALAVDPAGEFLYVPNHKDAKNAGILRFGRFPLDADGLPALGEKETKQPLPARAKRLTELSHTGALRPQLAPAEYVHMMPWSPAGVGHSFSFVGKEAILVGGYYGLMSWRPGDKVAPLHGLPLKHSGGTLATAHPTLPVVFATAHSTNSLFRADQFEGYLSLLPRQVIFPDTRLSSPPVLLGKNTRLAVGGHYHVYLADLDEQGHVQPDVTAVRVLNPVVRAMVYSERFDRLYVGVEVSK